MDCLTCRLKLLDASHNTLEGLPQGIGGCASLVELLCSNNSVSHIPESISRLQALRTLDIRANRCATHLCAWEALKDQRCIGG